ncbi:hypothetical protein HDU91_001363, partial [Kappamyces sp. JEL0680]
MGNEQSTAKAIASAKKRQDTSLVFRGEPLDAKWIPDEAAALKIECLKLIDMSLVTGKCLVLTAVPSLLFSVVSLKQLDLSQNNLVTVTGIGTLVGLSDLDLSGNRLDYLPDDLCCLTNLKFVNLSNNLLTLRSFPAGFLDQAALSSIDVSENRMTQMTTELAQFLVKAESAIIHTNPWESSDLRNMAADASDEQVKKMLSTLLSNTASGKDRSPALRSPPPLPASRPSPSVSAPPSQKADSETAVVAVEAPVKEQAVEPSPMQKRAPTARAPPKAPEDKAVATLAQSPISQIQEASPKQQNSSPLTQDEDMPSRTAAPLKSMSR